MLTAKKVMKRERFKKKTVVLSALEVLVFAPYGNSEIIVETAPVPVETCELSEISGSRIGVSPLDVAIDRREGGRIGNSHMSTRRTCSDVLENSHTHIHRKPCWWKMAIGCQTTGADWSYVTYRILSAILFFSGM